MPFFHRITRFLAISVVFVALVPSVRADEKPFTVDRGVEYSSSGDMKLAADIYRPEGDGPFPGVLVVHGGAWMTGNRRQLAGVAQRLAESGYVAVAISYRLAPKYIFPAQIEDCRAAVRWMRKESSQLKIDPKRVGGYGYSAGGHLVSLLATAGDEDSPDGQAPSARLQAVVAGGAPLDFRLLPAGNRMLAYWLGGSRSEKPENYLNASPAAFISKDDPPAFFFHGEKDRLVPIISPLAMHLLLKASGVSSQTYTVAGAGHIQALFDKEAGDRSLAFLDRVLKAPLPTEPLLKATSKARAESKQETP